MVLKMIVCGALGAGAALGLSICDPCGPSHRGAAQPASAPVASVASGPTSGPAVQAVPTADPKTVRLRVGWRV